MTSENSNQNAPFFLLEVPLTHLLLGPTSLRPRIYTAKETDGGKGFDINFFKEKHTQFSTHKRVSGRGR